MNAKNLLLILITLHASILYSHSGRTDEDGGHFVGGTKKYHYHDGKNFSIEYKERVKSGPLKNLNVEKPIEPQKTQPIVEKKLFYRAPQSQVSSLFSGSFSFIYFQGKTSKKNFLGKGLFKASNGAIYRIIEIRSMDKREVKINLVNKEVILYDDNIEDNFDSEGNRCLKCLVRFRA